VPGHHHCSRVPADGAADEGFTLVEMVIAIALSAVVLLALAASMMAGMRSLAVAKDRTRGNEVATQAIEDLQRFGFSQLVLCTAPPSPPAGLTDPVTVSGGCTGQTVEDSCSNQSGTAISYTYTCTRTTQTVYTVKRYIAWVDPTHTAKRLAVFVTWSDTVGTHTVSQQSSVRAPSLAAVIGLSPPSLTNPLVSGTSGNVTVLLTLTGQLSSDIPLQVDAANLTNADQVEGVFYHLDPYGNPVQEGAFLSPNSDGSRWTGSIKASSGYTFGAGTQYIVFDAIRSTDGKQNSVISTSIVTFCSSTCTTATAPSFVPNSMVYPTSVGIYPSGELKNSFTVSVQTLNTTSNDSVNVAVMSQTGLLTLPLQVDTTKTCGLTGTGCYWTTTVTPSAGYAFLAGNLPLYFTIQQDKSPDPTSVDQGSTVATSTSPKTVTFG
jgi:prepilin-type N-terminal cleavage/methylation domain-containing protein